MAARIPAWHRKSDEELAALVRGVWEGRIVGSWQLTGTRALEHVFPGFLGYQVLSGVTEDAEVWFEDPATALAFGSAPFAMAAYGTLPERDPDAFDPRAEPPRFPHWEMLSGEEWTRVRARLGYPPPAQQPGSAPESPHT